MWFKAWNLQREQKDYTKMETVMAGCCVQVQCTFSCALSHYSICWNVAFNSNNGHAYGPNLHAFTQLEATLFMYIAPCVKRRKMSQILVFKMQCSTWDHAKCIHFTGIYSMLSIKTGWEVHNDIQLISKKELKCLLSATAIWQKKGQKGALF